MSDEDQVKPYHARGSSGQETADVVADVLKHAAERDHAAQKKVGPKQQPKWMLPLAMNLGLLAVYFLVAQPSWTAVNPIQPPPADDLLVSTRHSMYYNVISRVDRFTENNGRLPADLAEAGAGHLASSVDYVARPDATYAVIILVGETEVIYDSATMTLEDFTGPLNLQG